MIVQRTLATILSGAILFSTVAPSAMAAMSPLSAGHSGSTRIIVNSVAELAPLLSASPLGQKPLSQPKIVRAATHVSRSLESAKGPVTVVRQADSLRIKPAGKHVRSEVVDLKIRVKPTAEELERVKALARNLKDRPIQAALEAFDGAIIREDYPFNFPPDQYPNLAGKTVLLIGHFEQRAFLTTALKPLGARLIIVDEPSRKAGALKLIPEADFIEVASLAPEHHDDVISAVKSFMAATRTSFNAVFNRIDAFTVLEAKLAEALGVPGNPVRTMEIGKNKALTREVLGDDPTLRVESRWITSEDEAAAAFRDIGHGIMKPKTGAGSQMIAEITSEDQARAKFREMAAAMQAMMNEQPAYALRFFGTTRFSGFQYEQYLDGPEYDVEGIYQNGKERLSIVTENRPTAPPYAIEVGDNYPPQFTPTQINSAKKMTRRVIEKIEFKTGNSHLEGKGTTNGDRLLEANLRAGGLYVRDAIRKVWGVDTIVLGLLAKIGHPIPDLRKIKPRGALVTMDYHTPKTGILKSFGPKTLDMIENPQKYGLYKLTVMHKIGDRVQAPPDSMDDYILLVMGYGRTHAEAKRNAQTAYDSIEVNID